MELRGRELELAFPLCLIAMEIEPESLEILNLHTLKFKKIFNDKKDDEMVDNKDVSLLEFVSQESENIGYQTFKKICENFKMFSDSNDVWINPKWISNALRRQNLIIQKRRVGNGYQCLLDVKKAQEKIKMYKE